MPRRTLKFGFRAKIYISILSIVLLTGVLIAVFVYQIVTQALSREYRNRGISLSVNLASRSEDPVLAVDFLRMKDLIQEVTNSADDVLYAFILDDDGNVLSHTFSGGFPVQLKNANVYSGNERSTVKLLKTRDYLVYDFATPVFAGKFRVGTVRLGLMQTKVSETINEVLFAIFAFLGLSVFIVDIIGMALANQVTKPVNRLKLASREILKGNLDVHAGSQLKKNCWEIKNCRNRNCPAYGDADRRCWYMIGNGTAEELPDGNGASPEKCLDCPVYQKNAGDEIQQLAESFDVMTLSLKDTISQLARSKETLERSEAKYRRIFEASMDLIFVADRNGKILDINRAGVSLLEYAATPDLVEKTGLRDLFVSPDNLDPLLQEIDEKGYVKDHECILRTRTGKLIQVLFSSTLHLDGDGAILGYEGIVKDITHRKNMELQLLQADKLASLGQLAAGVAHEINNPLGLILGYTQLLTRDEEKDSQKVEDLKTIEKHARSCKSIVQALLNFARKTGTKRTRIDINQTIRSVIRVLAHQFELDNIRIESHFGEGLPIVAGDSEKLKQVFMNLVMNAGQAISADGSITVTTRYAMDTDRVQAIVADSGPGIAEAVIGKIFDPFFTTKPTGQGTGLGLSVSYGIIQEHDGDIRVESAPGKGAAFIVELPAVCGEDPPPSIMKKSATQEGL